MCEGHSKTLAQELWAFGPEGSLYEKSTRDLPRGLRKLEQGGAARTPRWAAVEAGLGVTLRTSAGLPPGVQALGPESGLPTLSDATPALPT